MSESIAQLRAELVELIAGAIPNSVVHRTVPEQVAPPCQVVQPAEPFLFEQAYGPDGGTFAEPFVVSFEVHLLVRLDDEHGNEQASDQLDQQLDQLLDALRANGAWWLERMARPGALLTTDWIAHGQRVTVQRRVQL